MAFVLGRRSRGELHQVHPDLVFVVEGAIKITPVDFAVHDGLRTKEEQRSYVERGVSKTMNSYHLPQKDGYGWAVDLVPYINGKLRWEWKPIYEIAGAVHDIATAAGTLMRWGAVWDRSFTELDRSDLEGEVEAYAARRRSIGRKAFLDGPHFEILLKGHRSWEKLIG